MTDKFMSDRLVDAFKTLMTAAPASARDSAIRALEDQVADAGTPASVKSDLTTILNAGLSMGSDAHGVSSTPSKPRSNPDMFVKK